ncbi:MAG: MFS transporter, partial [Pseudonocardia sp.]|nr:MFS transporter [Pseudonocardia sp.]
ADRRAAVLAPMAVLSTAALVPLVLDPPVPVVLALLFLSGLGVSFALPLNALFVQALPADYRTRGFAVANGGLVVAQGVGILAAGAVAELLPVPVTLGWTGVLGTAAVLGIVLLSTGDRSTAEPAAPHGSPTGR